MLNLEYKDYTLDFKFEAGTSRGVMRHHRIWILKLQDPRNSRLAGYGEAAPLPGLNPETFEEVEDELSRVQNLLRKEEAPSSERAVYDLVDQLVRDDFPSLKLALQVALLDLMNGGEKKIFENKFFVEQYPLPINGLIWMGDTAFMKRQIDDKFESGFSCIKLKVGALEFEQELEIVQYLRAKDPDLTIRLDANGGFANNEVLSKLQKLSDFDIHSIEQPILPHQPEAMELICRKSPIPIAFDEELIGLNSLSQKKELLTYCKPAFLVLKPTLLGGFRHVKEWMDLADYYGIGWWLTSALESNIGLNAISQFAAQYHHEIPQGLGTGQLYENNIKSPLTIVSEYLRYDQRLNWNIAL